MRRSPRQRYPYFPGDHDPFVRPLESFHSQGGPPLPTVPQLSQRRDYYAEIFDRPAQRQDVYDHLQELFFNYGLLRTR